MYATTVSLFRFVGRDRAPGRINKLAGILLLLGMGLGTAVPCQAEGRRGWKKRWISSLAAFALSAALDIHSSRDRPEFNPLLRGRGGVLSTRKAVIAKSALVGGLALLQVLVVKKRPDRNLYRTFAITNSALAGATSFTAVCNYGVRREPAGVRLEFAPIPSL